MNIDASTAIGVVGALIGVLGAINSFRIARTTAKKAAVDNLCVIIETQSEHIAGQDTRIDRLEAERAELRSRLTEIEARYKDLCDWVRQLGYDPIARKKITEPLSGGVL